MSKQKQQSTFKLVMGLIGALFSFAHVALADPWTNGGSAIYVTDTSDIVGIGTTSPDTMLHIIAPTGVNDSAHFRSDNASSDLYIGAAASGVSQIRTPSSQGLSIATNNTERIRISSSGNVGIGVTSADTLLHVVVPTGVNDSAHFRSDNASSDLYIGAAASGVSQIRTPSGQGLSIATDNTERIRISSSGNVGIGATPSIDFAIGDSDTGLNQVSDGVLAVLTNNTERMRFTSGGLVGIGGIIPTIDFAIGDTDTGLEQVSDGELALYTNGTSKVRITSGGDVGIGTTTPTSTLQVQGKTTMTQSNSAWALYATSANTQDNLGAIYAESTPSSAGNTVGVWGVTNSSGTSNGQPIGIRGDAKDDAPTEGQYGVLGYNWAYQQTSGKQGAGTFGGSMGSNPSSPSDFTGRGHGVQGETYASNDDSAGGIFYTNNTSGGKSDAVRGIVSDSTPDADQYAFKGDGSMIVSGSKSALVNTVSQGPTEMYSIESSEIWFEDIGEGQLINGGSTIKIDPLFLETITVNDEHPMQVFIQPYDGTNMYVERGTDSFTVAAINDPSSSASFAYRIMGKREHYEDQRMRQTTGPIDHFMEPSLTTAELLQLNERWGFGEAFQNVYYHQFLDAAASEVQN